MDPILTRSLSAATYRISGADSEFGLDLIRGLITGLSVVHKFGRNPDIDTASGYEDIWAGGGSYTGFDATAAEVVETYSSDATDVGTVLSSGTLTSGSATTAVDTGADFSSDGVAAGDLVINDTQGDHMVIDTVATTTLTGKRWRHGTTPAASDAYRVVTAADTGAAVVRWSQMLDAAGAYQVEYVVLNGATGVDSTGSYLRNFRGRVVLVGSSGFNDGEITSRQKTTTANVFIVLPAGRGSTMVCAYTIPAGKTGYLLGWGANLTSKTSAASNARLKSRPYGEGWQVLEDAGLTSTGTSLGDRRYDTVPAGPLVAWTDIAIDADTDTNNTAVSGHFDIILVDD